MDRALVGGEVSAGAGRRSGCGLHFAVDQQSGDVGRRDDGAVDHNLRNDHRAARHEDLLAVVEDDQQVAAIGLDRHDVCPRGQRDNVVRTGIDDLGPFGAHGCGMIRGSCGMLTALLPVFVTPSFVNVDAVTHAKHPRKTAQRQQE